MVDCPGKRQEHFVSCSDIRIKGNGDGNGNGGGNGNGNGEGKGRMIIDLLNIPLHLINFKELKFH